MNKAIVTTSWDDGHPADLKLAELLSKHNVPATFYIPADNIERQNMTPQEIREIAQTFDVGGHTYHHVDLTQIPPQEAEKEIIEGKKKLEEITGRELLSFCYPMGKFHNGTISLVKAAGFAGARTMEPFTRKIKDPFRTGTTIQAVQLRAVRYIRQATFSLDPGMFCFMLANNLFFKSWDLIAIGTLDFVIKNGGIWHLWGHSWEIDADSEWARLDTVLGMLNRLPDEVLKVDNSQLVKILSGLEDMPYETPGV